MRTVLVSFIALAASASISQAETDDCMVGTWTAETGHLKAFYQRLQPAAPVNSVDGQVVMTIADDGAGTVRISDFVIDQAMGPNRMTNTGNGDFAFKVTTDGARYDIEFTGLSLNIKAHMHAGNQPPKLMAEVNQGLKDLPHKTSGGEYVCSADKLVIEDKNPEASPFPVWHR